MKRFLKNKSVNYTPYSVLDLMLSNKLSKDELTALTLTFVTIL